MAMRIGGSIHTDDIKEFIPDNENGPNEDKE
jgi:hypothetical protein